MGNLMVLLQIGSMPHELAIENIDLFAREVLPAAARRRGTTRAGSITGGRSGCAAPQRRRAAAGCRRGRGMMREQTIAVWQKQVRMRVLSKGSGPGAGLLPRLVGSDAGIRSSTSWPSSFTVYAPEHPGTTPECAGRHLSPRQPVGSGALLRRAAAGAGARQRRVRRPLVRRRWWRARWRRRIPARAGRLALIDPLGFWRDADPIANWMVMDPAQMRAHVFRDPDGDAARRMFGAGTGDDPKAAAAARAPAHVGAGRDRQVHLADPRQGTEEAHPPRDGADAAGVGQGGSAGAAGLRRRVHAAHRRRPRAHGRRRRPRAPSRAAGAGRPGGAGVPDRRSY